MDVELFIVAYRQGDYECEKGITLYWRKDCKK